MGKRNKGAWSIALVLLVACQQAGDPASGESEVSAPDGSVAVAAPQALTSSLGADADTTLRSGAPFANDGTGITLGVTSASIADVKRSLVHVSQTQIAAAVPPGEVLYSARLDLKVVGISAGWLGGAVDILPMTRSWPEGNGLAGHGPSWVCADDTNTTLFGNFFNNCSAANNWSMLPNGPYPQPFRTTATDRARVFTGGPTTLSFDVTADVRRYLAGDPNYGWMLAAAPNLQGGLWVNFGSREGSFANRPTLVVETGPDQCPMDPDKGLPGVCGCGNPDLDTNLDDVVDCFGAVAVATGDTTLRLATPFANDGNGALLGVTSASVVDLERSLVKVDNAAIDTARGGRNIRKAYLEMTVAGIAFGWAGGTLELLRMNRSWVEGNGLGNGLSANGASWVCANDTNTTLLGNLFNNCSTADRWGMQLFDPWPRPFSPVPSATSALVFPGLTTVRFDVTTDVLHFVSDPGGVVFPNHGWMVQGAAGSLLSGNWVNFGSRESGAPPRLLLELDPPCPPGGDGDRDADGVLDCNDLCPEDDQKSEPGACGCGNSDVDDDGDKIPTCIDPCPADDDPTLGGECGCPSGSPAPADTPCVGVCGDSGGLDTCNGAGVCGDPSSCPPPVSGCTTCVPILTTTHVYWYCPCGRDHETAAESCESVPGQGLVPIRNATTNAWVHQLITGDTWTAASDLNAEGEWRWSRDGSGTQFWQGDESGAPHFGRYANWSAGEPDAAAPDVDCGAIALADGTWQARSCSDDLHVFCARDLTLLPPLRRPPPLRTCELLGTCPPPDSGVCLDPDQAFMTIPGACPPDDPDGRCPAQEQAQAQLELCNDCVATASACQGTDQAACRTACLSQCSGAAAETVPGAQACTPFDEHLDPAVEVHCTLNEATQASPFQCSTHADCAFLPPGLRHCGRVFRCRSDGRHTNPTDGMDCTPTQGTTIGNANRDEICVGDNDECVAELVCGTPSDTCLIEDEDTEPCTQYDLCLNDEDDFLPAPPDNATALETPQVFDPQTFGLPEEAPVDLVEFPTDGPCPDGSYACTPPSDESHRWCRYEIDPNEELGPRDTPAIANDTEAGPGERLRFSFDPNLNLHYEMKNGPLGLPLPYLSASASLKAGAHVALPRINVGGIDIIDIGIGAHGGIQANLRPGFLPVPDPDALCGFQSDARAKVLSLDVLPIGNAGNLSIPTTSVQEQCVALVQKFTKAVDRARKAYADARELLRQYEELRDAGLNFGDGVAAPSLCSMVASDPPAGFPDWNTTCATEPPEVTIDRFVYYYNEQALPHVRTVAQQLADDLDDWSAAQQRWDLIPIDEMEEITIFNQTFMVGPVPVNLEVAMPVSYGFNLSVDARFQIGRLMNQLVIGQNPDADDPFAKIGVVGSPYAGAGISLFAGVGFDVGFAAAKIGIEGAIDLGHVEVPANVWAGLGATPLEDERLLSPAWEGLVDTNRAPLIPNRKLQFGLFYGYGAKLAIDNVLDGRLNAKLKLKFFWFSRTYRARIAQFTGFCATDGRTRQGWCDVTLFSSGPDHLWDWGTIKMPTPFLPLRYLGLDNSRPFTGVYDPTPAGELFYENLCQCIPSFPLDEDPPEDALCYRTADCCPGLVCLSGGRCGSAPPR